jgi:hypothetical protein
LLSEESARIAHADSRAWASENSVIAGSRNRLARRKVRLPANTICRMSSSKAGSIVTPSTNGQRRHQLAEHVLDAGQRLRQIQLQRIRAAVIGNQPGLHDDDEERQTAPAVRGTRGRCQEWRRGIPPLVRW